jgi:hypothetical protein
MDQIVQAEMLLCYILSTTNNYVKGNESFSHGLQGMNLPVARSLRWLYLQLYAAAFRVLRLDVPCLLHLQAKEN